MKWLYPCETDVLSPSPADHIIGFLNIVRARAHSSPSFAHYHLELSEPLRGGEAGCPHRTTLYFFNSDRCPALLIVILCYLENRGPFGDLEFALMCHLPVDTLVREHLLLFVAQISPVRGDLRAKYMQFSFPYIGMDEARGLLLGRAEVKLCRSHVVSTLF